MRTFFVVRTVRFLHFVRTGLLLLVIQTDFYSSEQVLFSSDQFVFVATVLEFPCIIILSF